MDRARVRRSKRLQVQADLVAAAENTEHVFERFWQVSDGLIRAIGGTGVGLAAAREFARMLGGDVGVESELGRGSVFTL
jgi:signal transduction histidine kinase